jgi:2-polyprenyl-6-methoxyphenol hydroxylase-like FAD-dependent oxidoreductase
MLDRWGVLQALHTDGALPITHLAVSHPALGHLATYDVPPQGEGPAQRSLAVPHDRIEAVLHQVAETWPSVRIEYAIGTDVERDTKGRVVGVRARIGEREQTFHATVVVGCDGMNSMVRRRLSIDAPRDPYDHEILFVAAAGAVDPPAAMHFHLSDRVILVASRPRGWMRVGVRFERDEQKELLRRPDPALHDFIAARVPELESIRIIAEDAHIYPLARQVAEHFAAPGVALVGDAAHTTHPAGSSGMSLAITGAARLAELIAPALAAPASRERDLAVDEALAAFDAERRPAATAAVMENHRQALRIWQRGVEDDPHAYAAAINPVANWGVGGAGWGQDPAALGARR